MKFCPFVALFDPKSFYPLSRFLLFFRFTLGRFTLCNLTQCHLTLVIKIESLHRCEKYVKIYLFIL